MLDDRLECAFSVNFIFVILVAVMKDFLVIEAVLVKFLPDRLGVDGVFSPFRRGRSAEGWALVLGVIEISVLLELWVQVVIIC